MNNLDNKSGKPLSAYTWLKAHHEAKIYERRLFAKKIIEKTSPNVIVDLGCGPGFWLDVFDEYAPSTCKLIGIDSDEESISLAQELHRESHRHIEFICLDIQKELNLVPASDLFLAFNIFPYLQSPRYIIDGLKGIKNKNISVRQYDGSLLRFGPLPGGLRAEMESSIHASLCASEEFHHYDMDRVFRIISESNAESIDISFEPFERVSPFPPEFLDYIKQTIRWNVEHSSELVADKLFEWYSNYFLSKDSKSYFIGSDLSALLSWSTEARFHS